MKHSDQIAAWMFLGFLIGMLLMFLLAGTDPRCAADEAWVPVEMGQPDVYGVERACELIVEGP